MPTIISDPTVYTQLRQRAGDVISYANLHFFDPVNNHIRITNGGSPTAQNGLIDTTGQQYPSMWQMECLENAYFNDWQIFGSEASRRRIADQWAYITGPSLSSYFTKAVLAGHGYNVTINTFDDACWYATYLMHVHIATGDPAALGYLAETIAFNCAFFLDPNTSGNPTINYGTSSNIPNVNYGNGTGSDGRYIGTPFKAGTYGSLYATINGTGYSYFGKCSSTVEAAMALCSLYVFQQLGYLSYLQYAVNTYNWIYQKMRTPAPADGSRKVQGIYETELCLATTGGTPTDTGAAFLTPVKAFYGKPVRGLDSTYVGATTMMAVLAARLYQQGGGDGYRQEAVSIANAMISLQGYGRSVGGKRLIACTRDPWSDGHWFVPFAREVLTLPGTSAATVQALADTGAYMAANCVTSDGYVTGDWAGAEPYDGSTWEASYVSAPGNQGGHQQIMTTGESISVMQGALIAASHL